MVNNMLYFFCLFIIAVFNSISFLDAQTIDPNRSDKKHREKVMMNSNSVGIIISNNGLIGKFYDRNSGIWPKEKNYSHPIEISILAGADVAGADNKRYKIISESNSIVPDISDDGKQYCWNPKPGYYNEKAAKVQLAHSIDPSTWPHSWPDKDASWNGKWNSYFGKNHLIEGDEAYYVADDFDNSEFPYYPFASDTTKRGLGLQCSARIFQWADVNADDQIFMHFNFTNASDNVYDKNLYLGAYGSIHPDGFGYINTSCIIDDSNDMFYVYNTPGMIDYRYIPFYIAYKLLESPGMSNDGKDNDQDGITDESNRNDAGIKITGRDNIIAKLSSCADIPKLLKFYGYSSIDEVPAVKAGIWWTGDENADWEPGTYCDDIGSDGIGPLDPGYLKPDADGTEGNGRPDQGEPHFGILDKNESDQIGFSSFSYFRVSEISPADDEALWNKLQSGKLDIGNDAIDGNWVYASGPLTLDRNQSEKFSAALIFASDAELIYRKAKISQLIYNYNYLSNIDVTGVEKEKEPEQISDFSLEQNYPNPFNPSTTISFSLPKQDHVSLKVYDLLGHEIAVLIDKTLPAGKHKTEFNTSGFNLPSGIYIYQLKVNNQTTSKKMTLMK